MQPEYEVDDILGRLDELMFDCAFPTLGYEDVTHDCSVGIRLHVYSSSTDWLLAFERLGYCAKPRAYWMPTDGISGANHVMPTRHPILFNGQERLWNGERFVFDPHDVEFQINGTSRRFAFSAEDYKEAGLDVDSPPPSLYDPEGINIAVYLLRLLDREVGDELYSSDNDVLKACKASDLGLRHLLTLSNFYLPPNSVGPSETDTFRMLAEVMVHQNPDLYRPTEHPNTRWSDWPFEGFRLSGSAE